MVCLVYIFIFQENNNDNEHLGSIHNLPRGWAMMILRGGHSFSLP